MKSNRREFLRQGVGAACGLGVARAIGGEVAPIAPARPNIVVLFSDDQRFDTIAALGNTEIETPNLDRLVARGTAFTQATIMGGLHGAICVPSRAMLHTGRPLFHLGGTGDVIPAEFTSLPETLRAAGYRTHAIGKWHSDRVAFNRIYNEGSALFFGGMLDHFNAQLFDYDPTATYAKANAKSYAGQHTSAVFADAALRFLGEAHPQPYFLYVAFTAPHDPRLSPPEYRQRYDPAKLTLPPNFLPRHPFDNGELAVRDEQLAPFPRTPEEVLRQTADYYAAISHLDAQVGRILEAVGENTIVVFAGDNGLALGRHGLMGKQSLYDHSIRVPLVLAGPGIPKGERRTTPFNVHDLFPTLCAALALEPPATVQSQNRWAAVQAAGTWEGETTFHAYRDIQRAVRGERYKLIAYEVAGEKRAQMFDLQEDPWEMKDLSTTHPELLAEMQAKLSAWRASDEFA